MTPVEHIATISLSGSTQIGQDLSRTGSYTFLVDDLRIDAFIDIKDADLPFLFCGQSALTEQTRLRLPVFHRHTWAADFSANFVAFNDPTLYLHEDLLGGWSQGSLRTHAIPAMHRVVCAIRETVGTDGRSIHYGSSAGGFWAMMLAALDDSRCMVEVPQTDMTAYPHARHRERLLDRCYRQQGADPQDYLHRLRVADWFRRIGQTPREIRYFQNGKDRDHIDTQLLPFERDMADIAYEGMQVTYYNRDDVESGHTVMHKRETVTELRKLLTGL